MSLRRAIARLPGSLEAISLLYVFVPAFLFCAGWLKPVLGFALCAVLAVGLLFAIRGADEEPSEGADSAAGDRPRLRTASLAVLLVVLSIVVFYSGIGGHSHQVKDYEKHNAFLRDLIEYEWPPSYTGLGGTDEQRFLATHVGYYLPAAVVGKAFGWEAANDFSLLWMIGGLLITALWFLRILGNPSALYALVFVFFGGLDIVGFAVRAGSWPFNLSAATVDYWMATPPKGLLWWYPANLTVLFWGPQHAIPAWLLSFMIMHKGLRSRSSGNVLFLWSASLLGSAFVAVGLAPLVLLAVFQSRGRKLASFQNLAAAPLLMIVSALYLTSNNAEYPRGWLWNLRNMWDLWPALLLFYAVEFGLFALFYPRFRTEPEDRPVRPWWWMALACLVVLPWYQLGTYGDLPAKAGIPSLAVFVTCLVLAIIDRRTEVERLCARVLVFLLAIGACTGATELLRSIHLTRAMPERVRLEHTMHVDEYVRGEPWPVARQLFADDGAFFWRFMVRSRPER